MILLLEYKGKGSFIDNRGKCQRPSKLSLRDQRHLKICVRRQPFITLENIRMSVEENGNVPVCRRQLVIT